LTERFAALRRGDDISKMKSVLAVALGLAMMTVEKPKFSDWTISCTSPYRTKG